MLCFHVGVCSLGDMIGSRRKILTEVEVESASASCRILLIWGPKRCKIKSAVVVAECWAIGGLAENESEKLLFVCLFFFLNH